MKQSKLFLMLGIFAMMIGLTSCEKEEIVTSDELPTKITEYIDTHFPNNTIVQVTKEKEGLQTTYEVILSDSFTLDFDKDDMIESIEAFTKLPDSVIPASILEYVNTNYPNNYIIEWEIDNNEQEVELNNMISLEFNLDGEFIRIDG